MRELDSERETKRDRPWHENGTEYCERSCSWCPWKTSRPHRITCRHFFTTETCIYIAESPSVLKLEQRQPACMAHWPLLSELLLAASEATFATFQSSKWIVLCTLDLPKTRKAERPFVCLQTSSNPNKVEKIRKNNSSEESWSSYVTACSMQLLNLFSTCSMIGHWIEPFNSSLAVQSQLC